MWFNMGIINGNDIKIVISKQSFPTLYLIKCQNKCLSSLLAEHKEDIEMSFYPYHVDHMLTGVITADNR